MAPGRTLTPASFNGHNINDGTVYEAKFPSAHGGFDVAGSPKNQSVESQRPERFPLLVRNQPESRIIPITVKIKTDTQANNEQLQKWFDPKNQDLRANNGAGYLVATDAAGNSRRIFCVPQTTELLQVNAGQSLWLVHLLATTATWEDNSATASSANIVASGQTAVLTNPGDTNAYPTLTITPNTVMAHANSWIRRRRLMVANRSELPWTDPVGDGWPVDATEDAWDTATLFGAGKVLATLNDARVVLEGAEINRWFDPATDDATTKTWLNLQLRARKTATLAANINNSVTALSASNADGFFGWPTTGFFLVGTECIQYTARTALSMTLVRGARNTTAASHNSGDILYWLEHPFLDIIYDYTGATDPAPPDDRKPRIDLASSSQSLFVWNAGFLNISDRRSAAWQPQRTDDGISSAWVTLQEIAGHIRFRDTTPDVTKPNFNNIYLDDPAGISTDASGISIDEIIQANLRLNVNTVDLGGNEVLVASWNPDENAVLTTHTQTLTNTAFRIRLNARIGSLVGAQPTTGNADMVTAGFTPPDGSKGTDKIISFSFVNDASEALVYGYAVRSGSTRRIIPVSATAKLEGGQRYHIGVTQGGGTFFLWLLQDDNGLPGTYADLNKLGRPAVGFGQGGFTALDVERPYFSRHYMGYNGDKYYSFLPAVRILTDGYGQAQIDAPVKTEEYIDLDNFSLKRDTTRTPKIVFAAEETLYLMNVRLKNDTTGDYLDLFFPNKLTNPITIDCANKRITDAETGLDIPFALSPSNPAEFLYLQPGANTISYTEVGVVSTTLAWSFRGAYL